MAKNSQILILVVAIAFFGWSGFWWLGSSQRQAAFENWFEDRRDAAWVADSAKVELRGYPNRFDTVFTDLHLADPLSGWAWDAPRFELVALSYQPEHMIAVWPDTQFISTPYEKISVTSQDMRASIVFEDREEFALDRFTFTGENLNFASDSGWDARAENLVIAARKSNKPASYDFAFDAKGFKPGKALLGLLNVNGKEFDAFDAFNLSTTATFSAPLDRAAIEDAAASLEALAIERATALWGELELIATGDLEFGSDGYANGKLTIRATNWKNMLEMAANAGIIDPSLQSALEQGLKFVAMLAGNENELDIPLTFANQQTKLGPIPIGEAPRIRLR